MAEADRFPESRYSAGAQATLLLYNAQDFDSESFPSAVHDELQRKSSNTANGKGDKRSSLTLRVTSALVTVLVTL